MNPSLTLEIVKHIYKKLGMFDNHLKFHSILSDEFLIDKKISFEDEDGKFIENNIWASSLSYEDKEIRLLSANCSTDQDPEYCIIISVDDSPSFGCYLSSDQNFAIISYAVNDNWFIASTYLQANFLAGMEQLKETVGDWKKCKSFNDLYGNLLEFIKHCDGEFDARQEN